jgi:hypothetical protein
LEASLSWRIGNGQRVSILGDSWIPQHSTYRIQSVPKVLDPTCKVKELINWEKVRWDQTLLANLFTKEEVAVIKTIPISWMNQPDVQLWRCTTSRVFSVKSAYHLAKELEGRNIPKSSK